MTRDLIAAATLFDADVDTASARFGESPRGWLPGDPRRTGLAWQAEVRLGRLRRPVEASVGELWVDGPSRWRALQWTPLTTSRPPTRDPRLPSFTGALGLRVDADGPPTLFLQGCYEPPGGVVGSAIDALLLQHMAQRTAEDLLADIRTRLTTPALQPTSAVGGFS